MRFNDLVTGDCAAGLLVIGIQNNGTVLCATDADSGTSNIFDQELNQSQNVTFAILNLTEGVGTDLTPIADSTWSLGTAALSWLNGFFDGIFVDNLNATNINATVIRIAGTDVVAGPHTTDTNETVRFNDLVTGDCAAGLLVIGIQNNGTVLCATDADSGTSNIFDQDLNTTSNVSFKSVNIQTDGELNMTFDTYNVFGEQPAFSLRGVQPESKPSIEFYSWDEATQQIRGVAWIVAHYNLSNGDTHNHFSIEVLDNSTGTPSINTAFEISYNASQVRPLIRFPGSDVNFISNQRLFFGDNFQAYIKHQGTSGDLELKSNSDVLINATQLDLNGGDLTNVDDIFSISGGSIDVKPDTTFRIFPSGQTTRAIQFTDSTTFITIAGTGADTIKFSDRVNVTSGLDVCIDGGNCLSDITGGAASNVFDQELNQSQNVTFAILNLTEGVGTDLTPIADSTWSLGTAALSWLNGFFDGLQVTDLNATNINATVIRIAGTDVVAGPHTTDTNETVRFNDLVTGDCAAGLLVIGIQNNGTVLCATDADSGTSNIFDQDLNTTDFVIFTQVNSTNWDNVSITESQISDLTHTGSTNVFDQELNQSQNVTFAILNLTEGVGTDLTPIADSTWSLGTGLLKWLNGFFDGIFVDNLNATNINATVIRIAGTDVVAGPHTTDTNETVRFNDLVTGDCSAGNLVIGIQNNGTVLCAADADSATSNIFDQDLNTTNDVTFNVINSTWGNVTITESQISDLTHTVLSNIFDQDLNTTDDVTHNSLNATANITLSNDVVKQFYNGTCFNIEVGGTLVWSMGCA